MTTIYEASINAGDEGVITLDGINIYADTWYVEAYDGETVLPADWTPETEIEYLGYGENYRTADSEG